MKQRGFPLATAKANSKLGAGKPVDGPLKQLAKRR